MAKKKQQTYDFDTVVTRRGTNSYKWDEPGTDDVIPMWVADMDFRAAPCIEEALKKRVAHGVFGYTLVPESYYQAVIRWFDKRHHWHIDRSWMLYTTGVVPAMSCAIKALTLPGEKVLVQTPVYNCFFSSIHNNGCEVVENPLKRKGDSYVIDFDDFERQCSDEKVTVFLLCNPHNPSSRVWTREELGRMGDICRRHDVRVISDEIHCELVMPGYEYTPFASIGDDCLENSVTLTSPSKAFNTAGLQIANVVCKDPVVRRRIDRAININEVCDVNPFGVVALEAAYNEGGEWLDQLNRYLFENYTVLKKHFAEHFPQWQVLRLEGTYLVWVDVSGSGLTGDEVAERLLRDARVWVNSGSMYGSETGRDYIRINIACPRATLDEALRRMGNMGKLKD